MGVLVRSSLATAAIGLVAAFPSVAVAAGTTSGGGTTFSYHFAFGGRDTGSAQDENGGMYLRLQNTDPNSFAVAHVDCVEVFSNRMRLSGVIHEASGAFEPQVGFNLIFHAEDNGDPGAGQDRFTAYVAGGVDCNDSFLDSVFDITAQVLTSGNIQVVDQ
jgi:hypothetical protein